MDTRTNEALRRSERGRGTGDGLADGPWDGAPLFDGLRAQSLELLSRHAFVQRVPAGAILADAGERPRLLHLLLDGLAHLVAEHDGHEAGVAIIEPVSPAMLSSVIADRANLAALQTLAPSRFLLIPADVVRTVFETDSAFARSVARSLVEDERRSLREIKNQKLRTAPERLANWILGGLRHAPGRMPLPFGKHVLALHVGTTRERLSRSFALLEEHGLRSGRKDLEIADLESLRRFAKPAPLIDDDTA
jgi:CRP/FNR family transcriptional activator FtrB